MYINQKFEKALLYITLISLVIGLITLLIPSEQQRYANIIGAIIGIAIFWIFAFYLTEEKKGSIVAGILMLLAEVGYIYIFFSSESSSSLISWYIFELILPSLAYIVFALFYFKNTKGIYLVLAYLCMLGAFSLELAVMLNDMTSLLVDIPTRLLALNIGMESKFYIERSIAFLIRKSYYPLSLIIFWFMFNIIKSNDKIDFSLRTIQIPQGMTKTTFSILYWMMLIILFLMVAGFFKRWSGEVNNAISESFMINLLNFIKILIFFLAVFILGSLYRNIVSTFFILNAWLPAWAYYFLNIPFINFFVWLFLLQKPSKAEKILSEDAKKSSLIDASNENILKAEFLKKKFREKESVDNKRFILFFIIFIKLIFFISSLLRANNTSINIDMMAHIIFLIVFILDIVLTIWYFLDKRAFLILFALSSFSVLGIILTSVILSLLASQDYLIFVTDIPIGTSGMIGLIILYPIFHFNSLKFVSYQED